MDLKFVGKMADQFGSLSEDQANHIIAEANGNDMLAGYLLS